MPVRKTDPVAETPLAPVPPGPNAFEIRVNGKIVFLQRVHSYTIDQQDDHVDISAVLKVAGDQPDLASATTTCL